METKSAPDWKCTARMLGGYGWSQELTRFYPTPDGHKRKVHVKFVSWAGVAPGAVHTHVSIDPGRNPVWTDDGWAELWDDPERDTITKSNHSQSFVSEERALRWAVRTLEREFPQTEWEHEWPSQAYDEDDEPIPAQWDPARITPDETEDAAVLPCPVCTFAVGEHTAEQARRCAECNDLIAPPAAVFDVPEPRVLVDAGPVTGRVGDDVLVLTDMHPDQVKLLQRARALIVERGGATAHLALVARELGVTVMLVPNAILLYPEGTDLDIDPAASTVTVW